jgi:hypothetical protein
MLYISGAVPNVASAVKAKRPIRVLALGPFPAASFGSGPGSTKYTVKLQAELQRVLPDSTVTVEARRLPGEITVGAPEYITNKVMEVRPNLVVWSAGTQDALARAEIDPFVEQTGEILAWLRSHGIDVVIVEPPYVPAVADDEHYSALVKGLRDVARRNRVPVVLRYEAMRFMSRQRAASAEQDFRLYDLSRHCAPEYAAQAVAASLALPRTQGGDASGKAR